MKEVNKSKRYRFIADKPGKGGIHQITNLGGQITTWSNDAVDGSPGWSWLGTVEEFRQQFVEV